MTTKINLYNILRVQDQFTRGMILLMKSFVVFQMQILQGTDKRRSLSNYVFLLDNNLFSWKTTLQPVVALSKLKLSSLLQQRRVVKEGLWLKGLLNDFGIKQTKIRIYCYNHNIISYLKVISFITKPSTQSLHIIP